MRGFSGLTATDFMRYSLIRRCLIKKRRKYQWVRMEDNSMRHTDWCSGRCSMFLFTRPLMSDPS